MPEEAYITVRKPTRFTFSYKFLQYWTQAALVVFLIITSAFLMVVIFALIPWIHQNYGQRAFDIIIDLYFGSAIFFVLTVGAFFVTFLPWFAGSPKVESWSRDVRNSYEDQGILCFVVEVILRPRVVTGFERRLDDADDVGLLSLWPGHLRYEGDSVDLKIPWSNIESIRARRVGHRGLWVSGRRIHIEFSSPVSEKHGMRVRVSEGNTIFHTRRRSVELAERLESVWKQAGAMG